MKVVYEVYGTYNDYEGDDWSYAICGTREVAERKLAEVQSRTKAYEGEGPMYDWEILEREVIWE